MMHLQCEHCGQKLQVPEARAGKVGRCPRCKGRVTVPSASAPEPPVATEPAPAPTQADSGPLNAALFDLSQPQTTEEEAPETRLREQEALARLGFAPPPKYTGERKFPWPIDILLYPVSMSGLTALAIIVGIPLLLRLVLRLLPSLTGVVHLPFFIIDLVIGLYAGWYLAECVCDSARGGTRVPEVIGSDIGLSGMWSRVSYLLAVYIIYLLPAVLYPMYFSRRDAVFAALFAWGFIFFPMGLLAMVMHDDTSVLNPLFLLASIWRVCLPYLGLLLLIAALGLVFWLIGRLSGQGPPPLWLDLLGFFVMGYLAFILAHLLGRFYWRYRDRFDWGL